MLQPNNVATKHDAMLQPNHEEGGWGSGDWVVAHASHYYTYCYNI